MMNGEHLCWEDDNSLSEVPESDPEILETSPVAKQSYRYIFAVEELYKN